jgi:hypothetical protein
MAAWLRDLWGKSRRPFPGKHAPDDEKDRWLRDVLRPGLYGSILMFPAVILVDYVWMWVLYVFSVGGMLSQFLALSIRIRRREQG